MSPRAWKVLQTFCSADTSTPTVTPVKLVLACAPPSYIYSIQNKSIKIKTQILDLIRARHEKY